MLAYALQWKDETPEARDEWKKTLRAAVEAYDGSPEGDFYDYCDAIRLKDCPDLRPEPLLDCLAHDDPTDGPGPGSWQDAEEVQEAAERLGQAFEARDPTLGPSLRWYLGERELEARKNEFRSPGSEPGWKFWKPKDNRPEAPMPNEIELPHGVRDRDWEHAARCFLTMAEYVRAAIAVGAREVVFSMVVVLAVRQRRSRTELFNSAVDEGNLNNESYEQIFQRVVKDLSVYESAAEELLQAARDVLGDDAPAEQVHLLALHKLYEVVLHADGIDPEELRSKADPSG